MVLVQEAVVVAKSPETFVAPEAKEMAKVVEAIALSKVVVTVTVLFVTFTMLEPVAATEVGAVVSTIKEGVVVAGAALPSVSRAPEMVAVTDAFICGAARKMVV